MDIKYNLAAAYQIMAYLSLDDHTYTHLSARPKNADFYYIYPFGLRFEEVTTENLLKVSLDGKILEGEEYQYNKTGYFIHGSIYKARPDISAIFHYHTPASIAVSALKCGLLLFSQWALHFYDRISYYDYNSLVLDANKQSTRLVNDLKQNYVMLLRNHGAITCGKTIHEAMFYTYHLEQACKTQILLNSIKEQELITPSVEICKQTVKDLLSFEEDLGKRDWEAWLRLVKM
ncbi:Decarboxylase NovR [Rickettsia tillamookensis]|uniref:Decarboxylase NovR n=1 Tax=Rickettsia tillamookensis TaxID=2761623 RepID=A0A9E6SQH4_9RICK|nr:class II aldolase/adducin family protein [Rickettsia tillamookensis]QQV75144.1 Decarboxylase NovR [Rickettsia tillamookensis]